MSSIGLTLLALWLPHDDWMMTVALYWPISASDQAENRLKKLIRIWRALHEYVNFVHDPEKQYSCTGSYLGGLRPVVVRPPLMTHDSWTPSIAAAFPAAKAAR